MSFLFENIFGILFGILFISLISCIKGAFQDKSGKEIIIEISLFITWYLVTVILNKFFPTLDILNKNKISYPIISIIIIEIISLFIKNRI